MNRRAITLLEIVITLAIVGILAAILAPVFQKARRFHAQVLPAQSFQNAPIQTVWTSLDSQLQKARRAEKRRPVNYLQRVQWQSEKFKARRVWLVTDEPLSLREILDQLGTAARVEISFGGGCGTCGSYDGPTTIRDPARKAAQ